MRNRVQRRLVLTFLAAAVPVAVASAAFACQSLATLSANPKSGPVGTSVTLTGANYSGSPSAGDVEIHLDSRTGPLLASTRADSAGKISVTFTVPDMSKGFHTFLATQLVNGVPKSGTPGRTSFEVTKATASASAGAFSPSSLATPVGLGALAVFTAMGLVVSRRRRATSVA